LFNSSTAVQQLEYISLSLLLCLFFNPFSSVTSIKYTPQGAHVATFSGLQLSADAVIITVPIGVLKAGTINFQPARPKRAAISGIGAGIENKVVLLFENVFWPGVEFLGLWVPPPTTVGYFRVPPGHGK